MILIVDDYEDNIILMRKYLPEYEFESTTDGAETIPLAEKYKPDLIILDIMMPVTNGFSIAKMLKENPVTADIPILFVTAKTNVRRLIKESDIDMEDYLEAPYDPKLLQEKVQFKLGISKGRDNEK
jgi:putative two-component system response regulator